MQRFLVVALAAQLTGAAAASQEDDPCAGENFERATTSREDLEQQYKGAILRITVGAESGTGYVIDAERGYVLTAFHVVQAALREPKPRIEATSPYVEKSLTLEYVQRAKRNDLALLKASDPSLLASVKPLDIALHFPLSRGGYTSAGYPEGKPTPNFQEATLQGKYDKAGAKPGRLTVKQNVNGGNSGGPLIDATGAVVATCVEEVLANEALYEPLTSAQDLLDQLPPDRSATALDALVVNGTAVKQLIPRLQVRPGGATNVVLYEWATHIGRNLATYDRKRAYFACPLFPAFTDRRLIEKAVASFPTLVPATVQARALVSAARQALQVGDAAVALEWSQRAVKIYRGLSDTGNEVAAAAVAAAANSDLTPSDVRVASGPLNIVDKVFFDPGSSDLKPDSQPLLDAIAEVVKRNPELRSIRIEGHADPTGPARLNKKLATDRAGVVRSYLIDRGVESKRLEAVGLGAAVPVITGSDAALEQARRVEFSVKAQF